MSPVQRARSAAQSIRWWDVAVRILVNVSAVFLAIGSLWMLFSGAALDKVADVLQAELRIEDLRKTANTNSASITAIRNILDNNALLLREHIPITIALYDYDLSHVEEVCYIGEECTAVFFVQRAPQWAFCDAPKVVRHAIVSRAGVDYTADGGPMNRAYKIGTTLVRIEVGFIPPDSAEPGTAFYKMTLEYKCGNEMIEQTTKKLRFILHPKRGPRP